MKQVQNTSWFSIVLALGITLLLSFTWLYLLEYMIPFSRNIKGIENASSAIYQTYWWLEEVLYEVGDGNIWDEPSRSYSWNEDFMYQVTASGTQLPPVNLWNSFYSNSRNILSQSSPIQLIVWQDRLPAAGTDQIRLRARIPDIDGSGFDETFDSSVPGTNDDILFWQLSSETDSLSASGSLITEFDLNSNALTNYRFWTENGVRLDGTEQTFGTFYNANCRGANECVLKVSVIHPLILSSNGTSIPYLEYRIDTSASIPLRYSYMDVTGQSQGFTKGFLIAIPQQTTNAAFDFTVFQ